MDTPLVTNSRHFVTGHKFVTGHARCEMVTTTTTVMSPRKPTLKYHIGRLGLAKIGIELTRLRIKSTTKDCSELVGKLVFLVAF